MKVCILMGSPRKQGNTNALLGPFRQELEGLGGDGNCMAPCSGDQALHGLPGLPAGLDGIRLRSAGRRAHDL